MRAAVLMQAILMLAVLLADTVRAEPSLVPNGRLDRNLAFATALDGGNVLQPQVVTLKSPYKAALFSALLPGTGELYAGHKGRGIAFLTAEVGIWVTYGAFKIQEDVRHDRAIEYAVNVAGANNGGTDDYYKAVGRFMRSDGPGMWNEFVRRRARDTGEVIGPEYFGADAWAWTSQANLSAYRELRRKELAAEENATNMYAFAILNRVLSVIDAVFVVRRDNRALEEAGFGLKLESTPTMARVMLKNRF